MVANIMQCMDAAESPLASYMEDIAARIDDDVKRREVEGFLLDYDAEVEEYGVRIALEVVRRAFIDISSRENPAMSMCAFLIAMGFTSIIQSSLEALGNKFGVTRAAVSKEIVHYRDKYGARCMGALKSDKAREIFSEVQKEAHAKRRQKLQLDMFEEFPLDKEQPSFMRISHAISSAWVKIQRMNKENPIWEMGEMEKNVLREDLKPLVDIYMRLK